MRRTGIVAAGVLLAVSAAGGILRVAPGEGAIAKAQAELRKAKAERPDEPWTVVLGTGEYRLSKTVRFTEEDSGRDGAPVTWRAENGALIRGGVDVGPWTDEGEGVVSAALPTDAGGRHLAVDMLFVNGVRASRSVLPKNRGTFKLPGGEKDSWSEVLASNVVLTALGREEWHVGHAVEYTRVGEDAAKVLAAVDPRELQFVQMQVLLDWSQARRRIVGWDGETRLVKTECFGGRPRHEQYRWCDRSRIRFENVRAGFTDPGDWFCDDRAGRILYRLRAGESAASLRAVAPAGRFSKLLALDGAHDLVFENVAFAFADAPQAKGDDPKRHNQTWQGQSARSYDAGVALANCRDVEFRACRVEHSGNYGFRIGTGCRRVRLVRCSTFDTGAGGVWLGADEIYPDKGRLERRIIREMYPESCASNVIADCTFRQGGRFQPEGTAIFVTHASDNLITHNLIDDFYYSGITLGYIWGYKGSPSQRNEVSFNRISRIGQDELYDLAAIYTLSASYGTVVSNNVISKVGGNGIYMDEGSEGVLIENNLVTDIEEAGAFMHFGTGCTFRNNIFAFNRKHGLAWASKREAMSVPSSINFLGNIFYTEEAPLIGERTLGVDGVRAHNVWWNPKGTGAKDFDGRSAADYLSNGHAYGDIVADPLFFDARGRDFRLRPESPALKLGFKPFDFTAAGPRMLGSDVTLLYKTEGLVGTGADWRLVREEKGKVVYIPFEGYYESKGGRIESPRFRLDGEVGRNSFYRLTFSAKCPVDGYWWVDFFDAKGELLPDVNSRLYASDDWRRYDVIVPAHPAAVEGQIAFVTTKGAQAKDVSIRRVTAAEAAKWCNDFAATLPKMDPPKTEGAWEKLPKTKAKVCSGEPVNVLFLGDSIVNDTWCGNVVALIQNALPKADLRCFISVRGSTGCWYYHEKEHFEEYVAKYSPDLVLIGGISNYLGKDKGQTLAQAEDWMAETIGRCQKIGAEVAVCTPPPSYEFRADATARQFDWKLSEPTDDEAYRYLYSDYERHAAARTGVTVWDLTTMPCEAISRSGKPLNWFKRDAAHNDDRGKQLIAQTLAAYFNSRRE